MKMEDQLKLGTWLLAKGEEYKARAEAMPSARVHYGRRMALQGAALACFDLCKEVLASDFNEVIYAEPKPAAPASVSDEAPAGAVELYKVGEEQLS